MCEHYIICNLLYCDNIFITFSHHTTSMNLSALAIEAMVFLERDLCVCHFRLCSCVLLFDSNFLEFSHFMILLGN